MLVSCAFFAASSFAQKQMAPSFSMEKVKKMLSEGAGSSK
jgi:hypothetical protein